MSNAAKIDENDKPTTLAYNETSGEVETVYTDPVTGAIGIFLVADSVSTALSINNAKVDANDKPTATGYDDTSGEIEALRCDDNGNILISIV